MDTRAMITESSFADAVDRTIGAMLADYGYDAEHDDFRVRFDRSGTFVEVAYDARRSSEVSVWLGQTIFDREPPLELADVLRATECAEADAESVGLLQTRNESALGRLLARAANLLRECASDFLKGDRQAFATAFAIRSRRAADYTTEIANRPALDAADAAWAGKDYGRVHELLNPIRDTLGEAHRRRLEFVEKRM
jgi:hypothetical protein